MIQRYERIPVEIQLGRKQDSGQHHLISVQDLNNKLKIACTLM